MTPFPSSSLVPDSAAPAMVDRVLEWVAIPSGTRDLGGLERMADALQGPLRALGAEPERVALPPERGIGADGRPLAHPLGAALRLRRRPDAPLRVLLCSHMDTVFDRDHPVQRAERRGDDRIVGPGVIDAKGSIVVMLAALEAYERAVEAGAVEPRLGWEVLLSPDEEIGSPGSAGLLVEAASRNDLALVYEPALPDGQLAGARKGSGNFTVVVRGRAAHAGREPERGRNAIHAIGGAIAAIARLGEGRPGLTVNVGTVAGGTAVNVVPDLALAAVNVRVVDDEGQRHAERELARIVAAVDALDGIEAELHGGFRAPPKPLAGATAELFERVRECAREQGLDLGWRSTGGVCDGNRLQAAGLAVVDTLGAVGGEIHTAAEYLRPSSLVERARLSAALLVGLASGRIPWTPHRREGGAA